jgi:hypothetical protein
MEKQRRGDVNNSQKYGEKREGDAKKNVNGIAKGLQR